MPQLIRYGAPAVMLVAQLLAAPAAFAYTEIVVENGLSPPAASNVFIGPDFNRFIVRNKPCGPPASDPGCVAPGTPTSISVEAPTSGQLYTFGTSSATVSNGIMEELGIYGDSSVTLSGMNIQQVSVSGTMNGGVAAHGFTAGPGAVLNGGAGAGGYMWLDGVFSSGFDFYAETLAFRGNSDLTTRSAGSRGMHFEDSAVMRSLGGFHSPETRLGDDSVLYIHGSDFTVNGTPVGYGVVSAQVGSVNGIGLDGAPVAMNFVHAGGLAFDHVLVQDVAYTGTLVLVPEPGTGMLTMLGLLVVAARRRV